MSPPRIKAERFPTSAVLIGGTWRRVRTVTCSKCGYPSTLQEASAAPLPAEVVAKKFLQRGWLLNGHALCPHCQAGRKPMSPASRRAAYCALAGVPRKPKEEATHMPEAAPLPMPSVSGRAVNPPLQADPPRASTWEQRRRIRDALDLHYDEEAGHYRQSFSDAALAAKLGVPEKWVRDLREANGCGPDANEAAALRAAEIEAVKAAVQALQGELLDRFDVLERAVRKLDRVTL